MTNLNSRQRKIVYGIGIILLLGPILYLGFPAEQGTAAAESSSGLGKLARLRSQYDLGEATLGKVDPSSSAMNLVLLGLRGPAASVLHLKAIDYQEKKQWAKLRTTVDSIILLQPHYVQIWKFQGWNLAYNVSREWDKVDDRYYWVKEGIKFLQTGTARNNTVPILFHNVGEVISSKMGISDEKKFFREFFVRDPSDEFAVNGVPGPDPAINPPREEDGKGIDSFLVAYRWFVDANLRDDNDGLIGVKGMTHVFFRQGPAKALINFAEMRSKEGAFEGHIAAWQDGYNAWMNEYGKERFLGLEEKVYMLNSTEDDLKVLAEENGIPVDGRNGQRELWGNNVKMVNFDFWKNYTRTEADPLTLEIHEAFAQAKKLYLEGQWVSVEGEAGAAPTPSPAQVQLEIAMNKWNEGKAKFPDMYTDSRYVDQALMMVQYWRAVHQLNTTPVPTEFPLKQLWDENSGQHYQIERDFLTETRARSLTSK